ncbi:MAG: hypothetical protein U9P38_06230 [Campylobacterota bacterium]|nr:hypothetical protein [Campylobacterota bacterium]
MKKFKTAFIDQILISFFLIAFTIIFIGTVSDELKARTKYTKLKKIVQTAVLSASKYYINEDPNEENSQDIALSILEQIPLGEEVKDDIVFVWDFESQPNNVIATIPTYTEEFFWFRLLSFDTIEFTNISAKANIIERDLEVVNNFVPIAVNGCTQEFETGDQHDFLLKAHDLYSDQDKVGFFALYDPSGGQSSFAHFKSVVDDVMKDKDSSFDINSDTIAISTVLSEDIANDVKQVSQAFGIDGFPGKDMTIVVLDCGSTADAPIFKQLIPVKMNAVFCADCCAFMGVCMPFPMSMMCVFLDMLADETGEVFTDIMWNTTVSSCNNNDLFRINLDILSNSTVVLEY